MLTGRAGLIRPVPQFSTSGALLQIQAQDALQFSKRWLWAPPDDVYSVTNEVDTRTPLAHRTLPAPAATAYTLLSPTLAPLPTLLSRRWNDRHPVEDCACTATSTSTSTTKKPKKKKPHTTTITEISTPTAQPTPPSNTTTTVSATADINDFVAMWIGILGVCLQRA